MPVNSMHDEVERLLTDAAAPELAVSRNPLIHALAKDHPLTSTRAQRRGGRRCARGAVSLRGGCGTDRLFPRFSFCWRRHG